jgi:hypothetical protein
MKVIRNVLCLHAQSADLKFLNPVRNRMGKLLDNRFRSFELTNQHSNAEAVLALRQAKDGFVVIFAHGSGDYLRGGEYRSRLTGENVEIDKFLTRDEVDAFCGKVVFCLSCDSNGLAEASISAGAIAFVGFDEVPFDRFDAAGNPIGSRVLVQHTQELIADTMKATIERFLTGKSTLNGAVDFLRLWINKHAVAYVRKNTSVKERREVAALFMKINAGIRYHGLLDIRFE